MSVFGVNVQSRRGKAPLHYRLIAYRNAAMIKIAKTVRSIAQNLGILRHWL